MSAEVGSASSCVILHFKQPNRSTETTGVSQEKTRHWQVRHQEHWCYLAFGGRAEYSLIRSWCAENFRSALRPPSGAVLEVGCASFEAGDFKQSSKESESEENPPLASSLSTTLVLSPMYDQSSHTGNLPVLNP